MKCHRCDQECSHLEGHYKDSEHWEMSGWTCKAIDWRKRALDAEARVKQLEASVRNLWETSNA